MATGLFNLKQVNQAISQGAWSGYIAPKWVEYLVVAGGGGGGSGNSGGGGGGGGFLTGVVSVAVGTSYTVTVGSGGAGGVSGSGSTGVSSVFGSISATGGGYGGGNVTGGLGGSGGGGGGDATTVGGQGTAGQGNAGGRGANTTGTTPFVSGGGVFAGGGGGAGTIGLTYTAGPPGRSGNGGAGIASSIAGTVTTFSGGGGGGGDGRSVGGAAGTGGVGGGGNGSLLIAGGAGTANTGGGGGGGGYNPSTFYDGGAGGSGIVVVRYPGNVQFYTGGAITYANGYIVHTFVASGTLAPTTPTVVTADYQISRSLRFNSADSAYLNRTPASATNRKTWTLSFWVKRAALGSQEYILFAGSDGNNRTGIRWNNDNLEFEGQSGGATQIQLTTSAVYRDVSAWYHIVYMLDTTQATSSERAKIYVNGSQVTAFGTATYPSQNADLFVNSTNAHAFGRYSPAPSNYLNNYLTEINLIDGQALTPSSFGATNANTGVWGPKAYTGTYGTNGFYLNFSDNSNTTAATLGKDYSGNGNNWTPNNFSVTAGAGNDSLVDSPTYYGTDYGVGGAVRGNYATLNPLNTAYTGKTLLNGNLDVTGSTLNQVGGHSTIQIPTTGQWYAECTMTATGGGSPFIGVNGGTTTLGASGASYRSDGTKELNGTGSAYGATWTTTDVIGIAVDTSAGSITFYKNGTSQGVAFTTLNTTFTTGLFFSCQGATGTASFTYNFGQRAWAYTPPNGFKALTTQNLPASTIGSSPTTLANLYFDTSLYTGTNATQSITNAGFQPDLVWPKARSIAYAANIIDSVRGSHKVLIPSSTAAEATSSTANGITAFNSNGFTLGLDTDTAGSVNASGQTFVAWQWRANGGTGVTNTAGSITSTVSANTTSGFSIVTYTGNATDNATIGHGLGVAPSLLIGKVRSTTGGWPVWINVSGFGANDFLALNTTDAKSTAATLWGGSNASVPTSTVFKVGNNTSINGSGSTYVVYCFAPVAGFSAFGSYTGNGSTDGVFVFTGMRPAYVLIKRTTSAYNWWILDAARGTINAVKGRLYADATDAESTTYPYMDFLSNGFKLRDADGGLNASGAPYIYACFAQNPFKYSLAR